MPGGLPIGAVSPCFVASARKNSPAMLRSEDHLSSKPEGALAGKVAGFARELGSTGRRGDDPEVRTVRGGKCRVGVAKIRRIGHSKGIHAELKLHALCNREVSQQACIQVKEARPSKDVASGSAIAGCPGHLSKRTHREIVAGWVVKSAVHEFTCRRIPVLNVSAGNNNRADEIGCQNVSSRVCIVRTASNC